MDMYVVVVGGIPKALFDSQEDAGSFAEQFSDAKVFPMHWAAPNCVSWAYRDYLEHGDMEEVYIELDEFGEPVDIHYKDDEVFPFTNE